MKETQHALGFGLFTLHATLSLRRVVQRELEDPTQIENQAVPPPRDASALSPTILK
jgi:hypothetical protein